MERYTSPVNINVENLRKLVGKDFIELSREEGREIFEYCERELKKLKKIKERQKRGM